MLRVRRGVLAVTTASAGQHVHALLALEARPQERSQEVVLRVRKGARAAITVPVVPPALVPLALVPRRRHEHFIGNLLGTQ